MSAAVLWDRPSTAVRIQLWMRGHALAVYAGVLAALIGLLAVGPFMFVAVPAGHVGVIWSRLDGGTLTERVFYEGTHVIFPWDVLSLYDVRQQNNTVRYDAIAQNGVIVTVEVALRYHVDPPSAGLLHKLVGPSYAQTLVYPKVGNLIYELVARADPQTLYSTARTSFQQQLLGRVRAAFATPPRDVERPDVERPGSHPFAPLVVIDDLMVSAVVLPPLIRAAIDHKLEQQQIMEAYDFRLARERKEAERKQIEAQGIRAFQDTVARNITPGYLRLRGVEATRALAESPNAKIVIIGGHDGLPVILNTGEDAPGAASAAPN